MRAEDAKQKQEKYMEWVQFIIFFIGVFGLFIWNRAESRADSRHMDAKLEGQRALLHAIWQESKDAQARWMEETRSFHERLCNIESRRTEK